MTNCDTLLFIFLLMHHLLTSCFLICIFQVNENHSQNWLFKIIDSCLVVIKSENNEGRLTRKCSVVSKYCVSSNEHQHWTKVPLLLARISLRATKDSSKLECDCCQEVKSLWQHSDANWTQGIYFSSLHRIYIILYHAVSTLVLSPQNQTKDSAFKIVNDLLTCKLFVFFVCGIEKLQLIYNCVKSVRIRSFSGLYSSQMRENADQNNSEYGHFLRSATIGKIPSTKL